MKSEYIEYQLDGKTFRGYLSYDEKIKNPRPAVLVAHAWKGQDAFARQKADLLAELGYTGFAVDLYGDGQCVESDEEAKALMQPLFVDRKTLRSRILTAYNAIVNHEMVNSEKMGAIGFCFGGLAVLELFRSGIPLKGIVTFHGVLGDKMGNLKAQTQASSNNMKGSALILHGYKDPLVSKEDIDHIQKEFSEAKIDWQMHIYGNASHAFTNPSANDPEAGLIYHPRTEKRSLQTMKNFLAEVME